MSVDEVERTAWAVLGNVAGLGPATLVAATVRVGGAAALFERGLRGDRAGLVEALTPARGAHRAGPGPAEIAEFIVAAAATADRLRDGLRAGGIVALVPGDEAYPPRLLATEAPPPVLYVRGDIRALGAPRAVAVVGTRRPTEAGRRVAGRIAGAIARAGAVVVSGLAVGIDGAAHAAALAEAAPTVAVLGGGHGRLFPRAHARLADLVAAEGGAVVAEVGPDIEPTRWSFPRRNRIISGLAEATVVVEATARSGALITASHALEQGRGCFVVPGPIDAPASAGCLEFLREYPDAARVVAGIEALLEDLGLVRAEDPAPARTTSRRVPLTRVEAQVAATLADGSLSLDALHARVNEPVATLLGALTLLEMRGLVVAANGLYRPAGRLATRPGGGRPRDG